MEEVANMVVTGSGGMEICLEKERVASRFLAEGVGMISYAVGRKEKGKLF